MPRNSPPTINLANKLRTLDGYVGHLIFDQRLRLSDNSTAFDSEMAFRIAKLLTEHIEAEHQPLNPVRSVSVVLGQSVFHARYIISGFLILHLSRQQSLIGVRRRLCSILGEFHLLADEAEIPKNVKVSIVPPAASQPTSGKGRWIAAAALVGVGLAVTAALMKGSPDGPSGDKNTARRSLTEAGVSPAALPATPSAQPPATAAASKASPHPLGFEFLPVTIATGGAAPRVVEFATHETTVAQYRAFLQATEGAWNPPIAVTDEQPVMFVSLEEANAFCLWLNSRGGSARNYRLPTDEEWSWAVGIGELEAALMAGETDTSPSAKDGKVSGFPWGSQSNVPSAILGLPGLAGRSKQLVAVAETWRHSSGLHGLEGNVREWVSTPYHRAGSLSVARGGSWGDSKLPEAASSARVTNSGRHVTIGFRICFDSPAG